MGKSKVYIMILLLLLFSKVLNGNSSEYIITPGDSLTVIVITPSVKIYSRGCVNINGDYVISQYNEKDNEYKAIGIINVKNLSLTQFDDSLKKFINGIWPNAEVSWDIKSPNYSISIVYWNLSSTIPYKENRSLWYYIKTANINRPPVMSKIIIIHKDETSDTISGEQIFSYFPQWGDIIYLESPTITITGGVKRPGAYPLEPGRDPYYYIRRAGGAKNRLVNINSSLIIKNDGKVIPIKNNPTIEEGDHIQVPDPVFSPTELSSILFSLSSLIITIYVYFFYRR